MIIDFYKTIKRLYVIELRKYYIIFIDKLVIKPSEITIATLIKKD